MEMEMAMNENTTPMRLVGWLGHWVSGWLGGWVVERLDGWVARYGDECVCECESG